MRNMNNRQAIANRSRPMPVRRQSVIMPKGGKRAQVSRRGKP